MANIISRLKRTILNEKMDFLDLKLQPLKTYIFKKIYLKKRKKFIEDESKLIMRALYSKIV
tara:strand:+ start:1062 stop:1244 length:183 start_codon:yes stop_codon:yes gene_type:complete